MHYDEYMTSKRTSVKHPIPPFYDERSEVLVLGSFPSPASREQGFFYGHPQNRMWKVLARIFGEPVPATMARRADFLTRHHIAMWDVLALCTIEGASDASITGEVPNDIRPILETAPIKAILCAGSTAARLYTKHIEPTASCACVPMPSTSPANAAWKLDALVEAWSVLREHVTEEPAPVLDVVRVVALEQAIAATGTPLSELMDRAGCWLAFRVNEHDPQACVVVLAGNGNNGGDGWVAARELAQQGHGVTLVCAKPVDALEAQPARDTAVAATTAFADLGVGVLVSPEEAQLEALLAETDVVVDAILGTGFSHSSVRPPFDAWITAANKARTAGVYVVAADCPSDLNAQTGNASTPHIQADETVTMIVPKTGLVTTRGKKACGTIHVASLCDIAHLLPKA